jgi:hypothetical protein
VPAELAALVDRMMAKAPEHRFQTPAEVSKALAPFFKKQTAAADGATLGLGVAPFAEADFRPADAAAGAKILTGLIAATEVDAEAWTSLIEIDEIDDDWGDASANASARADRRRERRLALLGVAIVVAVIAGIAVFVWFNMAESDSPANGREAFTAIPAPAEVASPAPGPPAPLGARPASPDRPAGRIVEADSNTGWRVELDLVKKALAPLNTKPRPAAAPSSPPARKPDENATPRTP